MASFPQRAKVVIIGGNVAGASCAARLRHCGEHFEIVVLERTLSPERIGRPPG